MKPQSIHLIERSINPFLSIFPAAAARIYSTQRPVYLSRLVKQKPPSYTSPKSLERILWGIRFCSGIMNAAGMFKNGEGYDLACRQGAGAYIAGTTTAIPQKGNKKSGISLPFLPYRKSIAASNWLGMPNEGDERVAEKLKSIIKHPIPLGASIAQTPYIECGKGLELLVTGLKLYDEAGVDFIEMNESCPNTNCNQSACVANDIYDRLIYVKKNFLDSRKRNLPVTVKFSNDTDIKDIPQIIDMLSQLGFDGLNFGNTSTYYAEVGKYIHKDDRKLFDFFINKFGGGISGLPLKHKSLLLASESASYVKTKNIKEFHVFRTGGIIDAKDLKQSDQAGISMNMWFTGYFEQFMKHDHSLYEKIYNQ